MELNIVLPLTRPLAVRSWLRQGWSFAVFFLTQPSSLLWITLPGYRLQKEESGFAIIFFYGLLAEKWEQNELLDSRHHCFSLFLPNLKQWTSTSKLRGAKVPNLRPSCVPAPSQWDDWEAGATPKLGILSQIAATTFLSQTKSTWGCLKPARNSPVRWSTFLQWLTECHSQIQKVF